MCPFLISNNIQFILKPQTMICYCFLYSGGIRRTGRSRSGEQFIGQKIGFSMSQ